MLLHGGVQLLREVIGYTGHAWLLLVAPTQAALVFAGFLVVFLFSIFAVSLCYLQVSTKFLRSHLNNANGRKTAFLSLKVEVILLCLPPAALFRVINIY